MIVPFNDNESDLSMLLFLSFSYCCISYNDNRNDELSSDFLSECLYSPTNLL